MPRWALFVIIAALCSSAAQAGVLVGRNVWSGVVRVDDDVLVSPGSSLEILPGTRVVFGVASGTKTDPAFWSSATEIAVEGVLSVSGTAESPVLFEGEGAWGGIVSAPGGRVLMEHARIRGAQEAILCVGSVCDLSDVVVSESDYGVVAGPGARLTARDVRVEGGRVGLLDLRGREGDPISIAVAGAADASLLVSRVRVREFGMLFPSPSPGPSMEVVGDFTVEGKEIWRGEVIIAGRVTVVPGAVLTLEPGTRVAFRRHDSNGDGAGEGELLILGGIRCRGTPAAPVVFESAEEEPRAGDWDKVSLISSEDPENVLEYAVFRHGTQALHAHFSRFRVENCYFEANIRGMQFQECSGVLLRRCVFRGNKQALRFRDSTVDIVASVFVENLYAVHAFRCELEFRDNIVEGNCLGGTLMKEGRTRLLGNRFAANRDGARLRDPGSIVRIEGNRFEDNTEDGLSLSRVEAIVEGNGFFGAGLDLASVEASSAILRRNVFGRSARNALRLKGTVDVVARENDWGTPDPPGRIHDREDDPALGKVFWEPVARDLPLSGVPGRGW